MTFILAEFSPSWLPSQTLYWMICAVIQMNKPSSIHAGAVCGIQLISDACRAGDWE